VKKMKQASASEKRCSSFLARTKRASRFAAVSSCAHFLFMHFNLKSLLIMRITVILGSLRFLEICLVDRCVRGCPSWLWTSSSTAATLSAMRDDHGRPLPALRLIEPVMRSLRRKSSSVRLFQFLSGNSLNSLLAENLNKNFIFKTQH